MPFRLTDTNSDTDVLLDLVEFKEEEEIRFFRVKNKDGKEVDIKYIPLEISNWDKDRFELYLFENHYLNAENDVFEVYENTLDERIGWIFPITILESNENDFADYKNLNKYKFIAYQKLLEKEVKIPFSIKTDRYLTLAEIFKNSIVCILSKDATRKIDQFNIENYILSFYKSGYLLLSNTSKYKMIYDRSEFVKDVRANRHRLNIEKSNFNVCDNVYTKALYKEHLLQSESYIIRFIFLYQIIEHFMQDEFDALFTEHLNAYQEKKLAKNDLKESILKVSRERDLIKTVINRISINQKLKEEFIQSCKYIFQDLGQHSKDAFSDNIYDLRNLITHQLRHLTNKTEALEKVIEIFERVMIDLLTNYIKT